MAGFVLAVLGAVALVPASASAATFTPVADADADASRPTDNFGTRTSLTVDNSPVRNAYLRFNVQGAGTVATATLRVYAETANSVGFQVRSVSDNTWGETTINYNNAPPVGAVVASSGPVTAGTWYTVDVSSLVSGDGLVSFALTSTSSTSTKYTSREGTNKPQLIAGDGGPPPPPPGPSTSFSVTREGSSYRAASPSGTTYTGSLKTVMDAAVGDLNGSGGGTITFASGTFDYGTDRLDVNNISNITFAGQGMDATTITNSSSAAADTEPFDMGFINRVTIRDMTVNAGGPFRSTSDAIDADGVLDSLVERVKVTGSRGRGIVLDGKDAGRSAERNTIRGCVVTGVPSDGIELLAAGPGNRVEGCTITNAGGHGIQFAKASAGAGQPNKKPSDNTVSGNSIDNSGQDGINLNGGDRNVISGNTVLNSSNTTANRDGIRLGTTDGASCDDNRIENNTSSDNQSVATQRYGIAITSALCNRTVISGNTLVGNRIGPILDQGTATQCTGCGPAPDATPPTAPTGLTATAAGANRVDLGWTASTDNVGVTEYRVFRDGAATHLGSSTTTSFADMTAQPSTTYSYVVKAYDAAGNPSGASNTASATTTAGGGGGGTTLRFAPTDDASILPANPGANFGSDIALKNDNSPVENFLVKFSVAGIGTGTVTSVKLRVYCTNPSGGPTSSQFYKALSNDWSEGTVTWNTAPAADTTRLAALGRTAASTWYEVDLGSAFVNADGTYSLRVTSASTDGSYFSSRQGAAAFAPELVVTTG